MTTIRRVAGVSLGILLAGPTPGRAQHDGGSQRPDTLAARLERADRAYVAENWAAADSGYAAVLAADPWNSRATYRLALLRRRRNPAYAADLFERYTELEPTDPWGYMAVGDVHSNLGHHHAAIDWYDRALNLAPNERDAVICKARAWARARDTDAAITAYGSWVADHPSDTEAIRELSRELQRAGRFRTAAEVYGGTLSEGEAPDGRLRYLRSMAAPSVTPSVGRSIDSDGIGRTRFGAAVDAMVGDRGRAGVAFRRTALADASMSDGVNDIRVTGQWRPAAPWRLQAALGFASASAPDTAAATGRPGPPIGPRGPGAAPEGTTYVTWQARLRYRRPVSGLEMDVRMAGGPLDASPLLVANGIASHDVRASVALPVRPRLRVRATGRMTAITGGTETNWRRGLGAAVAYALRDAIEVSVQAHNTWFQSPTTDGYFAPRLAKTIEAGSYAEFYPPWATLVAFDLGVGVQRTAEHNLSATAWHPTFRFWGQVTAPVAPRVAVNLEVEAYDARIGDVIASSSSSWRYGALNLGLRVGLR